MSQMGALSRLLVQGEWRSWLRVSYWADMRQCTANVHLWGVKRTFGGVSFRYEMPWSSCHKWEPYLVSSFKESGDAASWNSTGFHHFASDASRERSRPMLRWFLQRQIAAFERTWNYDAGYIHEVIDVDPRAMLAFGKLQAISGYRKG